VCFPLLFYACVCYSMRVCFLVMRCLLFYACVCYSLRVFAIFHACVFLGLMRVCSLFKLRYCGIRPPLFLRLAKTLFLRLAKTLFLRLPKTLFLRLPKTLFLRLPKLESLHEFPPPLPSSRPAQPLAPSPEVYLCVWGGGRLQYGSGCSTFFSGRRCGYKGPQYGSGCSRPCSGW